MKLMESDQNVANEYELSREKAEVARELSGFLADTYLLYVKTQGFHWNVVGSHFASLHKLFEEQYENLAAAIDECAERIRALGFKAPGSLAEFNVVGTCARPQKSLPTSG
jgi:starvation-inducible DNA-binding protein